MTGATTIKPEEVKQIKEEIESFKQKSTQYAATSSILSAHYDRLYTVSKRSLKRFDRIERTLEDKAYKEERRKAKKGATPAQSNAGT